MIVGTVTPAPVGQVQD